MTRLKHPQGVFVRFPIDRGLLPPNKEDHWDKAIFRASNDDILLSTGFSDFPWEMFPAGEMQDQMGLIAHGRQ